MENTVSTKINTFHYIPDGPASSSIVSTGSARDSSSITLASGRWSFFSGKKHVISFCQTGVSLGHTGFPPEYLPKAIKKTKTQNIKKPILITTYLNDDDDDRRDPFALSTGPRRGVKRVNNIIIIVMLTRRRDGCLTFARCRRCTATRRSGRCTIAVAARHFARRYFRRFPNGNFGQ